MAKRILVVTHHATLRKTRTHVLERGGYFTCSAECAEDAMTQLAMEHFDLVVIGRRSRLQGLNIDQEIRTLYPQQAILQIETGPETSPHVSRTVTSEPSNLLAAVAELLADSQALESSDTSLIR